MSKPNTANVAQGRSIPRCLHHVYAESALEDAQQLAIFLQAVVEAAAEAHDATNPLLNNGASLCFDLLLDKLSIVAGDFDFPTVALDGDDAPPLWSVREGGAK